MSLNRGQQNLNVQDTHFHSAPITPLSSAQPFLSHLSTFIGPPPSDREGISRQQSTIDTLAGSQCLLSLFRFKV